MAVAPRTLAVIAAESGFSAADVAFLAGLEESTVSRLWDDQEWLDRIKGRSLQSLVSVVPGVGEYVLRYSLADRRNRLAGALNDRGVEVDAKSFRALVCDPDAPVPEQYLSNALETGTLILDGDLKRAAGHLARFWGREQDYALGFLFGTNGQNSLLVDAGPLLAAAEDIAERLTGATNSFHAIVAQANLVHHLSRATGRTTPLGDSEPGRQTALAFRSGVMGRLIASDDVTVASEYARHVRNSPLAAMVEDWAFPTYTHDARPSVDFSLPRSLLLRETAAEVLREIDSYSDAYLVYLTETAIPSIIARDATFGLSRDSLVAGLRARRERVVLPEAKRACDAMLRTLGDVRSATRGGTSLDDEW